MIMLRWIQSIPMYLTSGRLLEQGTHIDWLQWGIYAISINMVASKSAFSTSGRVLSEHQGTNL
jgi:hypothetical protein